MTGTNPLLIFTYRILLASVSIVLIFVEYNSRSNYIYIQIISILLLILYILQIAKSNSSFVLSYFYQIYSLSGLLLSIIFISSGEYMFEIGEYGTANSAFWVCLLFFLLGTEAALYGYRHGSSLVRFSHQIPSLTKSQTKIILFLAPASMIAISIVILIVFKSPIILEIDRVTFWQRLVPNQLILFPSIFGQSFILIPILYYMSEGDRVSRIASIIFALCYSAITFILLGEKFSTFIIYIAMWTAVAAGYGIKLRFDARLIFLSLFILSILVYLIAFSYEYYGYGYDFIFSRIALQGQLLWSVMNEVGVFGFGDRDWACYFSCDGYESGTKYISAEYMLHGLYLSYEQSGSGLTGYMPALPILVFGFPVALCLHILASYFLGYIQRLMVSYIETRDIISSILIFKIYFAITIFWYAANVYPLRGVFLSTVALLAIWVLWLGGFRRIRA